MKYICRLLWYIATRLIILSVVAGLLILAFYLSMDTSNIYLLLRDGMQQRASVILTQKNADTLTNYFTSDFLMNDQTLRIGLSDQSPYVNYNVTGFTYQVSMESMWAWPWDSTATATIVEKIPKINGKVKSGKSKQVESANPPAWYGGRYVVTLRRISGQWKIAGLRQTQIIVEPTAAPTGSPIPAPVS